MGGTVQNIWVGSEDILLNGFQHATSPTVFFHVHFFLSPAFDGCVYPHTKAIDED